MKSTMFCDFGANGQICVTVSPEPFPRWTWNLYHWTQQGLRFIKTCLSMVTSPSHLEYPVCDKLWGSPTTKVGWSRSLQGVVITARAVVDLLNRENDLSATFSSQR